MTQDADDSTPRDIFEGMREMRDTYLDAMSKAMIDVVNSKAYTKATGSMMDGYLNWATPFRESLDTLMRQNLEQMSLPSRQEVAVLAERFTQIEIRLDDLGAKLEEIAKSIGELPRAVKAASVSENSSTAAGRATSTPKPLKSRKPIASGKAPSRKR